MALPDWNDIGYLPSGIHNCSGDEFIERFVSIENREQYSKPISDILDFARDRGALHLFVRCVSSRTIILTRRINPHHNEQNSVCNVCWFVTPQLFGRLIQLRFYNVVVLPPQPDACAIACATAKAMATRGQRRCAGCAPCNGAAFASLPTG